MVDGASKDSSSDGIERACRMSVIFISLLSLLIHCWLPCEGWGEGISLGLETEECSSNQLSNIKTGPDKNKRFTTELER